MNSIGEFFHMGGYAFYVWSSYGLTLLVLLANVLWSARSLNALRQRARQRVQQTASRSSSNLSAATHDS